jgi:hypothetical protein
MRVTHKHGTLPGLFVVTYADGRVTFVDVKADEHIETDRTVFEETKDQFVPFAPSPWFEAEVLKHTPGGHDHDQMSHGRPGQRSQELDVAIQRRNRLRREAADMKASISETMTMIDFYENESWPDAPDNEEYESLLFERDQHQDDYDLLVEEYEEAEKEVERLGGDTKDDDPVTQGLSDEQVRDLLGSVESYAQSFDTGRVISKASEKWISNERARPGRSTAERSQQAKMIVDAIRKSPTTEKLLLRATNDINDKYENLNVGDTLELNRITSFTTSPKFAEVYRKSNVDQGRRESVLLRLDGPSRSLPTDEWTGMIHEEHLTFGDFKVTGKTKVYFEDMLTSEGEKLDANLQGFDWVIDLMYKGFEKGASVTTYENLVWGPMGEYDEEVFGKIKKHYPGGQDHDQSRHGNRGETPAEAMDRRVSETLSAMHRRMREIEEEQRRLSREHAVMDPAAGIDAFPDNPEAFREYQRLSREYTNLHRSIAIARGDFVPGEESSGQRVRAAGGVLIRVGRRRNAENPEDRLDNDSVWNRRPMLGGETREDRKRLREEMLRERDEAREAIVSQTKEAIGIFKEAGLSLPARVEETGGRSFEDPQHATARYEADTDTIYINSLRLREDTSDRVRSKYWSQPSTMLHEFAHAAHWHDGSDVRGFIRGRDIRLTGGEAAMAKVKVSEYAATSGMEFVAEVLAGSLAGNQYDEDVWDLYRKHGGPIPANR